MPGYCEESYLVGNCEDCQSNSASRKRKISDLSTKPRQSNLSAFFNVKTKPSVKPLVDHETPRSKPRDDSRLEKMPSASTLAPPTTKKPSRLTVTTANGWKTGALATHQASEWLVINADKNKSDCVMSLNCSVCKAFADKINGMKNFSTIWAFTGSTNLRLSKAKDHARGEPHKRALDLHLKETKGQHAFERAESMKAANDSGQQLITTGIANMRSTIPIPKQNGSVYEPATLNDFQRTEVFLFGHKINILLTDLGQSVWENLDLGRMYRPHCVRSVLTTSVKTLPYRPSARLIRTKYSPRSWQYGSRYARSL